MMKLERVALALAVATSSMVATSAPAEARRGPFTERRDAREDIWDERGDACTAIRQAGQRRALALSRSAANFAVDGDLVSRQEDDYEAQVRYDRDRGRAVDRLSAEIDSHRELFSARELAAITDSMHLEQCLYVAPPLPDYRNQD